MKIWLDDVRDAPIGWTWYKTAESLLADLEAIWDSIVIISLDHDLGNDVATGYDVAKRIEEIVRTTNCPLHFDILVHSANPVGRKNIGAAIDSIDTVTYQPASPTRPGWQW